MSQTKTSVFSEEDPSPFTDLQRSSPHLADQVTHFPDSAVVRESLP